MGGGRARGVQVVVVRRSSGRFGGVLLAVVLTLVGVAPVATADVDTTPPVIHSLRFSTDAVTPGQEVRLLLDETDDVGIVKTKVTYGDPVTWLATTVEETSSPLAVPVTFPADATNRRYTVLQVSVLDAARNYSMYTINGSFSDRPASGAKTHDLDLAAVSVVLTGAMDRTPPVLTSLTETSVATRVGEAATYAWSATDAEHDVASVAVRIDTSAWSAWSVPVESAGTSGVVSVRVPRAGTYHVGAVRVVDSLGNEAVVSPGVADPAGVIPTARRTVAPGLPPVSVVAHPGGVSIVLSPTFPWSDATSLHVTAEPSGVVLDLPLGVLPALEREVPGLPNGVTQTFTMTLRSAYGDGEPLVVRATPSISRSVVGVPDVTGDGVRDVVGIRAGVAGALVAPGTGRSYLTPRSWVGLVGRTCADVGATDVRTIGSGEVLCRNDDLVAVDRGGVATVLGTRGWAAMRFVDGGFDLTSDGRPDVIGVDPTGVLKVWPQTPTSRLGPVRTLGSGWGSMLSVVSAGDVTGDRRSDLLAVDLAGRLWLYPGTGAAGFGTRRQIGSGWSTMRAVVPLGDMDRDGRVDILAVTAEGYDYLYAATASGGLRFTGGLNFTWAFDL